MGARKSILWGKEKVKRKEKKVAPVTFDEHQARAVVALEAEDDIVLVVENEAAVGRREDADGVEGVEVGCAD